VSNGPRARSGRPTVGSVAPLVPYLSSRDGADRGPAVSLVQARARERALRRAGRSPAVWDWRLWVAGALAAVAVALLATGGAGPLLGVAAGWGAAAAVRARYRPSAVEVDLGRQIAGERRAARDPDPLRSLGWTALHDRLSPGSTGSPTSSPAPVGWLCPRRCRSPAGCGGATTSCAPATYRWTNGSPPAGGRSTGSTPRW